MEEIGQTSAYTEPVFPFPIAIRRMLVPGVTMTFILVVTMTTN